MSLKGDVEESLKNVRRMMVIVFRNNIFNYAASAYFAKRNILVDTLKSIVNSQCFYGSSVVIYTILKNRLHKFLGYHNRAALFFSGFFASGVGSVLEDQNQLSSTLIFQGKDALTILGTLAVSKGILPKLETKYAYTLTFAIAMAILNYEYQTNPRNCSFLPVIIFKQLGGDRNDTEQFQYNWRLKYDRQGLLIDTVIGAIRVFGVSYFIVFIIGFMYNLARGNKTNLFANSHRTAVMISLFFGSINGIYRILSILLPKIIVNEKLVHILIGFLSAWSMLFWHERTVATLALANAIYSIFADIRNRGFPRIPYFQSILYGIVGAIFVYSIQFHIDAVPDSSKEFCAALAGQDVQFFLENSKRL